MESAQDIVGTSPAHQRMLRNARLVAPTNASVLLLGESGTGKELIAALIHRESERKGPFVPVNCAALPEALVDSLLFGHRRGAFTGATETHAGLVVAADGGTLFLDEIAELPLPIQAKLLRVLQQGAVLPMGETQERAVNVRIVAASHRDLRAAVSAGRFREDLYFRLAKFEIRLPALRERGRDVILIARRFLEQMPGLARCVRLARPAEAELVRYAWPGNVRELQNVLFRLALSADSVISSKELCDVLGTVPQGPEADVSDQVLAQVAASGVASCPELAIGLRCSRSTLKRRLRDLLDAGKLVSVGRGRATQYRLPAPDERPLHARERAALAIVRRDGRITRITLASETGLAPRTAGRVLAQMVEDGLLVPDGRQGSAAGYVLPTHGA
jgi:transcriptional regulator with GAF, ATPase, and Fis domain